MARGFKSTPKGYAAHIERAEARLLRQLFDDVLVILRQREDQTRPQTPDTAQTSDDRVEATGDVDAGADAEFWDLVSGLDSAPGQGSIAAPEDPATRRLLPDGVSGEDPEQTQQQASEFRSLTEDTIRSGQIDDLRRGLAVIERHDIVLDEEAAQSFARALNSVRLVLSTRLEIESEDDAARVHEVSDVASADSVDSYMALLYNFTSWLQETLMTAMLTDLEDPA